jgi:hypothetical protein
MDHPLLHPDGPGPHFDGLLDDLRHCLGAAEDIHCVNGFRNRGQIGVAALTQYFFGVGVNGDDAVALPLKILLYPVTVLLLPE